jgi:hypothetical protein
LRTDFNGFAECHTVLLDDGVWFALEAAAPAPLRRAA